MRRKIRRNRVWCERTITDSPSSPTARRSARFASWLISSLSQLWASGKRIKNSYTSPAKRRRGSPASSPAPVTWPGFSSSSSFHLHPSNRSSYKFPCFIHLVHGFSPALHIIPYSPAL
ncbi:hypothetical protein AMECASPLE_039801 [Ameca splendens]|uniref:Uncharacterized protein n=1 Tax=Ameca splendens TaxID=208324 RepID=A0ABV0XXK5_9TELE